MMQQILIVEDQHVNAEILVTLLEDKYDVLVVTTGNMAIKVTEIKKPSLILLDLGLPDISGFDVLKAIKSHPDPTISSIPIIITSADNGEASELKGLQMGAADYIFKPFNPTILYTKVATQLEMFAYRNYLQELVDEKTRELRENYNALTAVMTILIDERDNTTGDHISKVHKYVNCLLRNIDKKYIGNLSEQDIECIVIASLIHDIGKISISDLILLKPSKLTGEEFETMKGHTLHGGTILKKVKALLNSPPSCIDYAIEIAECHHEKFNGTGYPCGLRGEQIPFSARVVTLCDIYDALTSKRPYKKSFTHKEVCDILINGDGRTQPDDFDPIVLEAFIRCEKEFEKISKISNDHIF